MPTGPLIILDWLLHSRDSIRTAPIPTLQEWKKLFDAAPSWDDTADSAVAGGFLADRLAYAFASGYQAALRRMMPSLPEGSFASFCITEEGGGHPAAIIARMERRGGGYVINGSKRFITMADAADTLLVAASTGINSDGRNMIRVAKVGRGNPGVSVEQMPKLKFIPEVGHCVIHLREAAVSEDEVLDGDGFSRYIRPFRTVEDIHIFAAVTGHLFRIACLHGWDSALMERMLSLLTAIRGLAGDSPEAPHVHIALAGLQGHFDRLVDVIEPLWEKVDEETRTRWIRDRALLKVAGNARKMRIQKAWNSYGAEARHR
ncbi:MAG: acyl-CoA dehydrogenase family protein [Spirochaetes bacterium]|nr:acyl-CoA dehydrogenase family protein [Spirochaetota bacterium]